MICARRDGKNVYGERIVANRYDCARRLPPETLALWMEALRSSIPKPVIQNVLDLGCGTGRFTGALVQAFDCKAWGIEPSAAMLDVAKMSGHSRVQWKQGSADGIPLENQSVDLVFMSQVFHHLPDPSAAISEISRVLKPAGFLALRNGTREHNAALAWLRFFPEACSIEEERTPYAREVEEVVTRDHFVTVSHRTIQQLFAASYAEYFEKISRRGWSALIAISDESFEDGLKDFKQWIDRQPPHVATYEPVDLFIFQKKAVN